MFLEKAEILLEEYQRPAYYSLVSVSPDTILINTGLYTFSIATECLPDKINIYYTLLGKEWEISVSNTETQTTSFKS
jgi:hypothetical protein